MKLSHCLVLLIALISLISCISAEQKLVLHSLPTTNNNHWFPLSGEVITDGETLPFTKDDTLVVTMAHLRNLPANNVKLALLHEDKGLLMATIDIPLKAGNSKSEAMKWTWVQTPTKELNKLSVFGTIDFGTAKVPSHIRSGTVTLDYSIAGTTKISGTAHLEVHHSLAHMAHFNTTCSKPREECLTSPYTASIQDVHHDLSELSFTVIGASTLAIDGNVDSKLSCTINNVNVHGHLVQSGRRTPYYKFIHNFKKGYDYVIECPRSSFKNPYTEQAWSLASFTGRGTDTHRTTYVNLDIFNFLYDQYLPVIRTSSASIGKDGVDYIFTHFLITSPSTLPAPDHAKLQFEFTGVKVKSITPLIRIKGGQLEQLETIKPNAGYEYPFIDFSKYIKHKNIYITMVGQVATDEQFNENLIQSRIELQYRSLPPAGHTSEILTNTAIADIHILDNLSHDDHIVVTTQGKSMDIPIKLKKLTQKPTEAHITYTFSNPQLHFDAKENDVIKCSYGKIDLAPITLKLDTFGNYRALSWSKVDLSSQAEGNSTFHCDHKIVWDKGSAPADIALVVSYTDSTNTDHTIRDTAFIVVSDHDSHRGKDSGGHGFRTFIIIVVILALLGVGGYFGYQYYVQYTQNKRFVPAPRDLAVPLGENPYSQV